MHTQLNLDFFEPPRIMKIDSKNWVVREICDKITNNELGNLDMLFTSIINSHCRPKNYAIALIATSESYGIFVVVFVYFFL